MYKKYFCTFADSRMKKSLQRVEKQVRESNFFDKIFIYDENDLDPGFREYFKDKLVKGSRGYGYWVWKPQIILQTLKQMQEGDVLLYMDAGCHFNKNGLERMNYYFEQVINSPAGILAFHVDKRPTADPNLEALYDGIEKFLTKGDLFDFFGVRNNTDIVDTGQIMATAIIFKKCKQSEKFVTDWLNVFRHNFNLINNSPSISPNFIGFIEHRHDQSVLSILCKLRNVPTISAYETWQIDWKKLDKYPIQTKRDKDLSLFWRIDSKINSIIKKIGNINIINRNEIVRIKVNDLFNQIVVFKLLTDVINKIPDYLFRKYKNPVLKKKNKLFYEQHQSQIADLLNIVNDDLSKEVINGLINFYRTFNFSYIKNIFRPLRATHIENNTIQDIDHYFSSDIIKLSDNEGFVNCGSYNGDTIKEFISQTNGKFKHIFAFEPNKINYISLCEMVKKLKLSFDVITCYQKGVYSENTKCNFKVNKGGSFITEDGEDIIDVIKLDSFLSKEEINMITFVNMDIEGAELEALKGMKDIIKINKPKLAISVYHKLEHFWEIPFFIKSLNPEYKIYFRQHALSEAETVCYAI